MRSTSLIGIWPESKAKYQHTSQESHQAPHSKQPAVWRAKRSTQHVSDSCIHSSRDFSEDRQDLAWPLSSNEAVAPGMPFDLLEPVANAGAMRWVWARAELWDAALALGVGICRDLLLGHKLASFVGNPCFNRTHHVICRGVSLPAHLRGPRCRGQAPNLSAPCAE
jgi:hypothetical protein